MLFRSKLFWFENFWVAHSGFLSTVAASWKKPTQKANSAANLNAKFKRLRYDLKRWSKSISKMSICIDNCNKALLELDNLEDKRGLTIPEANFRRILKEHLLVLLDYQRQYWKRDVPFDGQSLETRILNSFILLPQTDTEETQFPS